MLISEEIEDREKAMKLISEDRSIEFVKRRHSSYIYSKSKYFTRDYPVQCPVCRNYPPH